MLTPKCAYYLKDHTLSLSEGSLTGTKRRGAFGSRTWLKDRDFDNARWTPS